jgi:glycogen(starch) synthase
VTTDTAGLSATAQARRVLHVSWEYPPVSYGGLGRHVAALTSALAQGGVAVDVVTDAGDAPPGDDDVDGVRVRRVRRDPPSPALFDDMRGYVTGLQWAQVRAGLALGDRAPPDAPPVDVVHAHDWVSAHAGVTLAAALRVPLVATVHATEAGLWGGWIGSGFAADRHEVERFLVRHATAVVVCSAAMAEEVTRALQAEADRVHVVPNGVTVPRRLAAPASGRRMAARAGVPASAPLLLQVGRLAHEKGVDLAVDALVDVHAAGLHAHLVVIGDGPEQAALHQQVTDAGLGSVVHLIGRQPDGIVAAWRAAADVVLVPSRYEPFGLVALEAMAAARPVVAAAVGGLVEAVPAGCGVLVPPENATALGEAVTRLLADPGAARSLGRRARAAARRFTWQAAAERTVAVYERALVSSPPGASWSPDPAVPGNVLSGVPAGVPATD